MSNGTKQGHVLAPFYLLFLALLEYAFKGLDSFEFHRDMKPRVLFFFAVDPVFVAHNEVHMQTI